MPSKTVAHAVAGAILFCAAAANATTEGYVIVGDGLYRIESTANQYTRVFVSEGWTGATTMAHRQWNGTYWVYVIQDGTIWRASGVSDFWQAVDTNRSWPGAANMTWSASTNKLYIVNSGYLHRMESIDTNGTYTRLGNQDWYSTRAITSLGNWLYILRGSSLYKVDPNTGAATLLGGSVWSGSATMRMVKQNWGSVQPPLLSAYLYVLDGDSIYQVNPNTGARSIFGTQYAWPQSTTIFCHGIGTSTSSLYVIQDINNKLLRVDAAGGWHQTDGQAFYDGPTQSAGADCYY